MASQPLLGGQPQVVRPDDHPRFAAPRPDVQIFCGAAGQNATDIATLLDCLKRGLPIHASQNGIRAAGVNPEPFLYCQTSGSGGRVKTIRRSPASWIASYEVNHRQFGFGHQDHYAILGHLGHSLALYATLEAMHLGAGLQMLAGDSPRRQMQQLSAAGVSVIYATPTQLRRLQLAGQDGNLPAVRHIICGGGKLDDICRQGMAALCPNAVIREFYGASETSFITLADDRTPADSVGRAYPDVRIRLDEMGRIFVASPYLFDGYAETDLPLPPYDGEYIGTGDIGWLDDDGNLFLRGRENRMVTVSDRNLFLEDIEALLLAAGAGLCAAVAVPDPIRGHAVVAVIEGRPDDDLIHRIRRSCREVIGDHGVPRRIEFLPRLPQLASDKPDLAAMARMFSNER